MVPAAPCRGLLLPLSLLPPSAGPHREQAPLGLPERPTPTTGASTVPSPVSPPQRPETYVSPARTQAPGAGTLSVQRWLGQDGKSGWGTAAISASRHPHPASTVPCLQLSPITLPFPVLWKEIPKGCRRWKTRSIWKQGTKITEVQGRVTGFLSLPVSLPRDATTRLRALF